MLVPCGKHLINWEEILCIQYHEHELASGIMLRKFIIHLKGGVTVSCTEDDVKGMLTHVRDVRAGQ